MIQKVPVTKMILFTKKRGHNISPAPASVDKGLTLQFQLMTKLFPLWGIVWFIQTTITR